MRNKLLPALLAVLLLATPAVAADYFLNSDIGDDSYDGLSDKTA